MLSRIQTTQPNEDWLSISSVLKNSIMIHDLFELSNEQRMSILQKLFFNNAKLSVLSKELGVTTPEVFRNLDRLEKAEMIVKLPNEGFAITTYGRGICYVLQSFDFLSKNKKFFQEHHFGNMPKNFVQEIGMLQNGELVNGFVKMTEYCLDIINDSNEYIYGMLVEEPLRFIEPAIKKAKKGVQVKTIFSESTITSKERVPLIKKLDLNDLTKKGRIERKMSANLDVIVVLNEKHGGVMFPNLHGKTDISMMYYGKDPNFHKWCLNFFNFSWNNHLKPFIEKKLNQ